MEEPTTFNSVLREAGGSLELTVDSNMVKFLGLEKGDLVKVLVRKIVKED